MVMGFSNWSRPCLKKKSYLKYMPNIYVSWRLCFFIIQNPHWDLSSWYKHAHVHEVYNVASISLLHSCSGRSHVTLPVPMRLLQTDIHSFLSVSRFCLLGPMSLSFSCHCICCTSHRREHSQENESHTLIGLFPRKECMSV